MVPAKQQLFFLVVSRSLRSARLTKVGLLRRRALHGLTGVGTGDGDGVVGGLVVGDGAVLLDRLPGRRGRACAREGILLHLGGGGRRLRGGSLEFERGLGLGRGELGLGLEDAATRGEGALAGSLLDVAKVAVGGGRVAGRHGVLAQGRGLGAEAGGVGSGLAAELGEVKIGTGFVTHVHGLCEAALGVVAVKEDAVEGDGHDFDNDFDDNADQRPVLHAANEGVVNFVPENG